MTSTLELDQDNVKYMLNI